jgi:hypothetical protein
MLCSHPEAASKHHHYPPFIRRTVPRPGLLRCREGDGGTCDRCLGLPVPTRLFFFCHPLPPSRSKFLPWLDLSAIDSSCPVDSQPPLFLFFLVALSGTALLRILANDSNICPGEHTSLSPIQSKLSGDFTNFPPFDHSLFRKLQEEDIQADKEAEEAKRKKKDEEEEYRKETEELKRKLKQKLEEHQARVAASTPPPPPGPAFAPPAPPNAFLSPAFLGSPFLGSPFLGSPFLGSPFLGSPPEHTGQLVLSPTPSRSSTPSHTPNPAAKPFRPSLGGQVPPRGGPLVVSGSRPPSRPASRASNSHLSIVTNADDEGPSTPTGFNSFEPAGASKETPKKPATESARRIRKLSGRSQKTPATGDKGKGPVANDEDFPALPSASTVAPPSVSAPRITNVPKLTGVSAPAKPKCVDKDPAGQETMEPTTGGPMIEASDLPSKKAVTESAAPADGAGGSSSSTPVPSVAPSLPGSQTDAAASKKPTVRTSRTLRLVPSTTTSTAESSAAGAAATVAATTNTKNTSSSTARRRGSSDTPGSEGASETTSTAGPSRGNSPGPQIQSTVSLRRKERRKEAEREAAKEAERVAVVQKEESQDHVPIVGRKRKVKKFEKPSVSPVAKEFEGSDEKKEAESADRTETMEAPTTHSGESPKDTVNPADALPKGKDVEETGKADENVSPPPPSAVNTPAPPPAPERPAGQQEFYMREIKRILNSKEIDMDSPQVKVMLEYLDRKPRTGAELMEAANSDAVDSSPMPPFIPPYQFMTPEIIRMLRAGLPLAFEPDQDYAHDVLITTFGDVLPHLSSEEQTHYVELQNGLANNLFMQHPNYVPDDDEYPDFVNEDGFTVIPVHKYCLRSGRLLTIWQTYSPGMRGLHPPISYAHKMMHEEALEFANHLIIHKFEFGGLTTNDIREVPGLENVVHCLNNQYITNFFVMLRKHTQHCWESDIMLRNSGGYWDEDGVEKHCPQCPPLPMLLNPVFTQPEYARTLELLRTVWPQLGDPSFPLHPESLIRYLVPTVEEAEKQRKEAWEDVARLEAQLIESTKRTYLEFFAQFDQPDGSGSSHDAGESSQAGGGEDRGTD